MHCSFLCSYARLCHCSQVPTPSSFPHCHLQTLADITRKFKDNVLGRATLPRTGSGNLGVTRSTGISSRYDSVCRNLRIPRPLNS